MNFVDALLGILTALALTVVMAFNTLLGAFSITLSVPVGETPLPEQQEVATTTAPAQATATVPEEPASPAPKPTQEQKIAGPATSPITQKPPAPAVPEPALDPEVLNTQTRAALVNILCITKAGGYFKPISGSGVLVDTRGVILTNAHVGQFFLLRDYPISDNVECVVRSGSPARTMYQAELLYLPPAWVAANADQITKEQGVGTGENDYAFLYITGPTGPSVPYPGSFPALVMTGATPEPGDSMLLAAYPAGFLDGQMIEINLYISSAYAAVRDLFTFTNPQQVDLFSIGGTVVSQGGSSGGAAVRAQDGKLSGIIVTSTVSTTTSTRDLRAISIAHINRSLGEEGQGGLVELLSQNLSEVAARFASSTAPAERQALIDAIEQR